MLPRSSAPLRLWNTRGHHSLPACCSLVRPSCLAAVGPCRSRLPRFLSYRTRLSSVSSAGRAFFSHCSGKSLSASSVNMGSIERVTESLEKPELDDRSYRVIRLPNQLEALLVHDPDTDKASASVNVNVGNFNDPQDLPGLFHGLEHLLFMGTHKVSGIALYILVKAKRLSYSSPRKTPTTSISHLIRDRPTPILPQQKQTTFSKCLRHRQMSRMLLPPPMDLQMGPPTVPQSRKGLDRQKMGHHPFMELWTVLHSFLFLPSS